MLISTLHIIIIKPIEQTIKYGKNDLQQSRNIGNTNIRNLNFILE